MANLKAIPTIYADVTFKSRLEARFAEFLHTHHISWEYEPLHFIADDSNYTPDFWIKGTTLYVEIKPKAFLNELNIFSATIRGSRDAWICIDNIDREWKVLLRNDAFVYLWNFHCAWGRSEINFDPASYSTI